MSTESNSRTAFDLERRLLRNCAAHRRSVQSFVKKTTRRRGKPFSQRCADTIGWIPNTASFLKPSHCCPGGAKRSSGSSFQRKPPEWVFQTWIGTSILPLAPQNLPSNPWSRNCWQRRADDAKLFRRARQSERMRLKLKRRRKMLGEILPVVAARIQMKLVRDAVRRQQLVELLAALVESKIILGAAIEINLQPRRTRPISHDRERALALPERRHPPANQTPCPAPRPPPAACSLDTLILGNLSISAGLCALTAHEQIRIAQRESQRAIAAHRNARDAARLSFRSNPIVAFDVRHKFADEKILVAHFAVARIDVEASARRPAPRSEIRRCVSGSRRS